jgi:general secretion pathway protein K
MKSRRGFALLAAIWLVVAIAVVALQFSLDARERRVLGINAAEGGQGRAAALGALNATQAALDAALRQGPGSGNMRNASLRGSDPWLDADSLFSGTIVVDSTPVEVAARDLGTQLNINDMNEAQLRTFFSFGLKDFSASDHLTETILDWRDADSIPRPNGGERDQYMQEGKLALPANQPFREVSDLLDVDGFTPEIYRQVAPYLTTRGSGIININEADTVVLRSVPGMTDRVLVQILALRGRGRRITSMNQILAAAGIPVAPAGRGGQAGRQTGQQTQLLSATTVDVTEVGLTITARVGPQRLPVRLNAIITRTGTASRITWKQW